MSHKNYSKNIENFNFYPTMIIKLQIFKIPTHP